MEKLKRSAIITAAGLGLRLPGKVKKQFRILNGKPLLIWAIKPFTERDDIERIIVSLPSEASEAHQKLISEHFSTTGKSEIISYCEGGSHRQESIFNALKLCSLDTQQIIIHDGVRPFVSAKILDLLIKQASEYGAAIPGAPVKNTIKTTRDDIIDRTLRRDILLEIFTPQIFDFNILMKCYHKAMTEEYHATDDAALLEHYGYSIHYTLDNTPNLKITDEFDLYLAEQVFRYLEK